MKDYIFKDSEGQHLRIQETIQAGTWGTCLIVFVNSERIILENTKTKEVFDFEKDDWYPESWDLIASIDQEERLRDSAPELLEMVETLLTECLCYRIQALADEPMSHNMDKAQELIKKVKEGD